MRRFSAIAKIGAILGLVVLLSAAAFGQAITGTILGRVTDSAGALVPGATIQIMNPDTGFSRTDQTDSDGRYLSSNLPLGSYSVTVQKQGFQTLVRNGIVLSVGSEVTVNAELVVGDVQQHVEVTGVAPQIETTNATISELVTPDQMRDLPLNGRDMDQLALLTPGVFANRLSVNNGVTGPGMHLSVNGARPDSVLYLLDGTVVNDHTNNGRGGATGEALGLESILEFRLLTHNFSAEYGRNGGGVINAVTRSGTNELHGSAYEFVRNNIFDARNFFNPGALPAFRRNQFGAAAGGRIIKDRLFFFVNYEGLRQRQGNTIIATVPNVASRATGVAAIQPYLNLYPLPTPGGKDNGDGTAQSITNYSQPGTDNYAMERVDLRLSDKDTFFARYVFDPSESVIPLPVPTFVNALTATDHFVELSETHAFSGASLNDFRFAFNRTERGMNSYPLNAIPSSLSFVPGQPFGTISYSQVNGSTSQLSQLGINAGGLQFWYVNLFQGTETFSTIRGAHSLKFGVDFERQQLNNIYGTNLRGNYQFGGLASLLAGTPKQFRFLLNSGQSNPERGWRRILISGFVQDDFRIRPNLTLNLGLRYDDFTAPTEASGRSSYLVPVTASTNTLGPPFMPSKLNFAPRVGLAWDPTGSGKTSVRLGAGVFYNLLDGRSWYADATQNAEFLQSYAVKNAPFPNALGAGIPVGALQANNGVVAPDTPTVIQYNLELQMQLAPTLSVRVGYVGSHGYSLPYYTDRNLVIPQILPNGSEFFAANGPVPNPNFGSMETVTTGAHSNYNGLQVVLQKTLSAGLTFQASYTYSKAQSEADEITSGQVNSVAVTTMDPNNLGGDYSLSAYDQRHNLVLNGAYQMPWDKRLNGRLARATLGGWAINGIFSYGSGHPLTILDGLNNSNSGDGNAPDRPNLNSGFSTNPTSGMTAGCTGVTAGQALHTPTRWFDPCAFTLSAAGTFGNLGRNTVIGPGLVEIDFALVKTTSLTEKTKLEFRAESFNLANHANFGLPINSVFNSSGTRNGNAGTITGTATDNREIQLGLKFMF